MTPLSHLLPPLPGFTALARTYAPWPVWTGSTTSPVRFAAMPKKAAVRLWHRARDFDRGTHQPGPPRWRRRPHRAGRAARADLRLPEPPHRPPGPVLRRHCRQGRRLRPHGRHARCSG